MAAVETIERMDKEIGSKAQAANQLYTENIILKELGVATVETIERVDEEIELKDNKINVLEDPAQSEFVVFKVNINIEKLF